jgi:hypothetical protein
MDLGIHSKQVGKVKTAAFAGNHSPVSRPLKDSDITVRMPRSSSHKS